jgi:hypothetical protein
VRARVGLVEAQESRDADCGEIQRDLMASYDRGVKASGRARRHMRECAGCRDYRDDLRGMRRRFAALAPAGAGPLALIAQLLGGGGAAAAGGSGGAALLGGATTATACKVAAVVCATALTAGGAVEVRKLTTEPAPKRERSATPASASAAPAATTRPERGSGPVTPFRVGAGGGIAARPAQPAATPRREKAGAGDAPRRSDRPLVAPPPEPAPYVGHDDPPVAVGGAPQVTSGGTAAPDEAPAGTGTATDQTSGTAPGGTAEPQPDAPAPDTPVAEPSTPAPPAPPTGGTTPPPEH